MNRTITLILTMVFTITLLTMTKKVVIRLGVLPAPHQMIHLSVVSEKQNWAVMMKGLRD